MRFALLALLASGPTHGYDLKRAFEERFGSVWPPVNIGQVYSTLQRLERDGLVTAEEVPQAGRPAKKVYALTAAGRDALAAWMDEPAAGTRLKDEFFLKFVLARLTGASDPYELIERQRAEALRALRDLADLVETEDDDGASLLLIEGAALHLQADLRWLDRCEEMLAGGGRN